MIPGKKILGWRKEKEVKEMERDFASHNNIKLSQPWEEIPPNVFIQKNL